MEKVIPNSIEAEQAVIGAMFLSKYAQQKAIESLSENLFYLDSHSKIFSVLASLQEEGNRKQSEYAIVYLQKLLQENHLKMSDFDEMVITIGPGSYTGVRVALTIAKTLNATMNIKVKTVSSLKAMAGMKKAISILDARSHKLFLGIYNEGKVIVDDCLINIDEFENYQKQYTDYEIVGDTHLVGIPEKEVDLANHIYTLSTLEKEIENVDGLVPRYIKEVEAKKICQ